MFIEGGPVSRCEAVALPVIVDECRRELQGIKGDKADLQHPFAVDNPQNKLT